MLPGVGSDYRFRKLEKNRFKELILLSDDGLRLVGRIAGPVLGSTAVRPCVFPVCLSDLVRPLTPSPSAICSQTRRMGLLGQTTSVCTLAGVACVLVYFGFIFVFLYFTYYTISKIFVNISTLKR